jgi:hypothetical protein
VSGRYTKHAEARQALIAGCALLLGLQLPSKAYGMELVGKATLSERQHGGADHPIEVRMSVGKEAGPGPHCELDRLLGSQDRVSLYLRGIRATGQPTGTYRVLIAAENQPPSAAVPVGEINFYGITAQSARDVSFFIDTAVFRQLLVVSSHCSIRVTFVPARPRIARAEFAIESIELWAGPI